MIDKSAPLVSIVIPVYNVEKYLRECLDSVINQTMREIQIICVNDGSTDSSLAILQEYANKDSRIEIVDKPNGGLSSARNAAYPFLKGKYTLFVDSDDWINLDLCEKAYRKAKESGADLTCFFSQMDNDTTIQRISICDKMTVEEKIPMLRFVTAWSKLCRTDFLQNNALTFPVGLIYEDNLFTWKAVTLAQRIAIVPEKLYYYRFRAGSITQSNDTKGVYDRISIFNLIEEYLLTSGFYSQYHSVFHSKKCDVFFRLYPLLPVSLQSRYKMMLQDSLNANDLDFLRSKECRQKIRLLYQMIFGSSGERQKAKGLYTLLMMGKSIENIVRKNVIYPIKKRLKAA